MGGLGIVGGRKRLGLFGVGWWWIGRAARGCGGGLGCCEGVRESAVSSIEEVYMYGLIDI